MGRERRDIRGRRGLWLAVLAVCLGLGVAAAAWLGVFSSEPAPGERIPPTAIPAPTSSAPAPSPTPSPTATDEVTTPAPPVLPSGGVREPAGRPVRIEVFAANGDPLVDAPLQSAELDADGILAPPHGVAGWYSEPGWAKPGWPGASIIAGHVRGGGQADVFWNIPQAKPGDIISVTYDSGQHSVFRVTRSEAMHKNDVPKDDSIWDHASPTPKLSLITCDPATPTRSDGHLEGNWVLWAEPLN